MDAPFGILFLKKVELYNLIKNQRKKAKVMKIRHPKSPNPITWPVEEEILKWTYHGHKYLAGPIKKSDFDLKESRKMRDWELLDENKMIDILVKNKLLDENKMIDENKLLNKIISLVKKNQLDQNEIVKQKYQQAVKQPNSIFKNIVAREYARYEDDKQNNDKQNSIIINKEGLLLGEVIYNTGKSNYIKNSYRFFSWIMDSGGAWVLLVLVILTIIMTLFVNLWNIFS